MKISTATPTAHRQNKAAAPNPIQIHLLFFLFASVTVMMLPFLFLVPLPVLRRQQDRRQPILCFCLAQDWQRQTEALVEGVEDLDGERLAGSQLIAAQEKVLDQNEIVVGQPFDGESFQRYICPRAQVDCPFYRQVLHTDGPTILHDKRTCRQIAEAA